MQLLLKEQCTQKFNFLFTLLNTYDFYKEISTFIQHYFDQKWQWRHL